MVAFAQESAVSPRFTSPSGLSERGDFWATPELAENDDDVFAVVPRDVKLTETERIALGCDEINRLEAFLLSMDQMAYPLSWFFIPKNGMLDSGMYVREVFLPAGAIYTTQIHRTEHPFVMSKGVARVWTPGEGWKEITGPFTGVTKAATRRVINVIEPVVWTTFHATNETNHDRLMETLVLPHQIVCRNPKARHVGQLMEALK